MRRLITAPGALTEPTAQALETALEANDQGFWLDIENPDEPDYALLQEIFHFHPLTLEDIRHENQRPKLEEYGEYSFAVLFTADWSGQELKIREHHLYISKRYLVSVHLEPSPELEQIHQRLKATPELTKKGLPFLFYLVVDKLVDEVFTVIDQLDAATDTLEDAILARDNREALGQIYGLKRAVFDLRKVLGAQRDLFQRLTTQSLDEQEMTLYFRDVYDHVVRQYETVDSLRDLLTSAMDVYLSTVSNRLNEIMRRLTMIATLFMPLTFITGFFGMNFLWLVNHISTFGAFMVGIGLMVATLMAQFLYFRRSGWV